MCGDCCLPLQAKGLSKQYGFRAVLRDVTLQLSAGELVGLLGPNGSGKTTLLGCLASVIRPTEGEVRWFGEAVLDASRRGWIGLVSHQSRLYPQLSLQENLVFAARMHRVDEAVPTVMRVLQRVGLEAHAGKLPSQVSQGMRQRVAISRALLHDPSIVLLDEPFTGLDVAGRSWLVERLIDLKRSGRAICLVTHDVARLSGLADRYWQLEGGRLQQLAEGGEIAFRQAAA